MTLYHIFCSACFSVSLYTAEGKDQVDALALFNKRRFLSVTFLGSFFLYYTAKINTMQQAIPYKSWLPLYTNNKTLNPSPLGFSDVVAAQELLKGTRNMSKMVAENAIIVFARRGCCMSHVVKRLLLGLGVNPPIYEIDEQDEISVLQELEMITENKSDGNQHKNVQFPAVFIGGSLFGGLDRLMATHITGELVPILKEAGALWL